MKRRLPFLVFFLFALGRAFPAGAAVPSGEPALPAAMLSSMPAYFLLASAGLLVLSAGILLFVLLRRRLARLETEKTALATQLARHKALGEIAADGFIIWSWAKGDDTPGEDDAPKEESEKKSAPAIAPVIAPVIAPGLLPRLGLPWDAGWEDILSRFTPSSAESLRRACKALFGEGRAFDLELCVSDVFADSLAARHWRVGGARHALPGGERVVILCLRDVSDDHAEREHLMRLATAASGQSDALRRVLDSIPYPVWLRDGALKISYCNRKYAEVLETDVDTVLSEGRELRPAATGGSEVRALARRAVETGLPQSESRHVVVNGVRRLVEFREIPLIEAGSGVGVLGLARDFTDLESVQNDLSRHIAAHSEVLEDLSIAIAIFGPDKKLKFFNTAYARLWELEPDFLAGEPEIGAILDRLHEKRRLPEHADFRSFREDQRRLFTSIIEPHEELLHLPDDTTLRSLVAPHPFGGLLFTYEDVTDRLALERSYNTLIDVQRESLDHLFEAIAVFGDDGCLRLSNPAYARIWDLPDDFLRRGPHISEIIEHTRRFFASEETAADSERLLHSLSAREAVTGRCERRDGTTLEYHCVPLPDGNALLTFADITDRQRAETALRERAQALETAARLKSEFIANVSYELRTPLNTIIGFSEILANRYFGDLNERQAEYSRGILDSSKRLLTLVNDILDLAMIEAGSMELDLENIDVKVMLDNVMGLIGETAEKHNLTLERDYPDDIGLLYADARRIRQAVYNLLSNAVKFTLPGGRIRLAASQKGEELHISVADTGIGIARERQEKLFDKFERGRPTKGGAGGVGLGLALVKNIIRLHGGSVSVESEIDQGTCVTLVLPLRREITAVAPVITFGAQSRSRTG